MKRRLLLLATLLLCGCRNWMPDLGRPGTAPMQQRRATLHDPYPDPVIGPTVVGGRPREYQVPQHEGIKNRNFADRYLP